MEYDLFDLYDSLFDEHENEHPVWLLLNLLILEEDFSSSKINKEMSNLGWERINNVSWKKRHTMDLSNRERYLQFIESMKHDIKGMMDRHNISYFNASFMIGPDEPVVIH